MELLTVFAWAVVLLCVAISVTVIVRSWQHAPFLREATRATTEGRQVLPGPSVADLSDAIEAACGAPQATPLLLLALHHPDARVRELAVESLAHDQAATASIRWISINDPNERTRVAAAEALATMRSA